MKRVIAAALFACALMSPSVAAGQSAFARAWVDVDFGIATAAEKEFTAPTTFTIASEPATFTTIYSLPRGTTFGVGGGIMINKKLGFGVNVGSSSHEEFGTLTARVPHPFFFNAYGTDAEPTDQALPRSERAIHMQVMFVALDTGKLRIRVFGGPSYITVKQSMVDDFTYVQTFNFNATNNNTIAITANDPPVDVTASAWGLHVGGDVSYFFTKTVGAGGFVRLVRGSVDLENVLDGNSTINVKAGGFQLGGGLRLRF